MGKNLLRRVLIDEVWHLLTAYLVVIPILYIKRDPLLSLVPILAVLMDLDHFVAAKGFSLERSLNLPRRPAMHSITLTLLFSSLFVGINPIWGIVVLIVMLSHVARDLSSGTVCLFWPSKRKYSIKRWTYYLLLETLFITSLTVSFLIK